MKEMTLRELQLFALEILKDDHRGAAYLHDVFHDIAVSMGCSSVEDAIRCFRMILEALQMKYPESMNYDSDLDILSHSVNPIRL